MTYLNEFIFPVRVYYEDTDAGGVVYHANYLRFMERARTEWLRTLGFEQDTLAQELNAVFVVAGLEIAYRKPARFNDALLVDAKIDTIGRASLLFKQEIWREGRNNSRELLTTASVKVVCVNTGTFRSMTIPTAIRELLQ
ncbi:tol-pal system-associated acyl-CoA thioesterase [Thiothrix subterranea]|uniref:Tol-pal system-associated acyl-CoA thioesterase n=1 Tax=Thiothrix subterranea TaxID=2735563 RepID=A0AA51MPW5_9GAMM|nr:tol-pal system-associated acyl-CoA thioesterase [Thiothrix subterranea]MDQ5767224.1 tol-pal system-associated acyl-CoA thioesterase [Thiothrix subterranea]WML87913.1 tol-pal system-associated acyl-CoA thioesterase [Thiothrix subterranea]